MISILAEGEVCYSRYITCGYSAENLNSGIERTVMSISDEPNKI